MPRKKFTDPKRVALEDKLHKALEFFEFAFTRMLRALHRCERAREAVRRLTRQLKKLDQVAQSEGA